MQGTTIRKDTQRKPSAAVVQVDLPRVLEVGDRVRGRVARVFDKGWGYAFVEVRGAADIFVSAREVLNAPELRRGDCVDLDVRMDGQGRFQGANVMLVDGEPISRWQTHSHPNGVAIDAPSFPPAPWED